MALVGVFPASHEGHDVCDTWLLLIPLVQHDRAGIDFLMPTVPISHEGVSYDIFVLFAYPSRLQSFATSALIGAVG